jgi:lipopolysaccharide export system permease protein
MFTSLLLAGTYLNKITDYVARGVPMDKVMEVTMLLMPAILVKTFSMSVLLAALLSFGRLSSDSEIVALRAGGASILRIVSPVIVFSLLISVATFWCNEQFVPAAANRAKLMLVELADDGKLETGNPTSFPISEGGRVRAMISARSFNLGARTMSGVTITAFGDTNLPSYLMYAPEMEYRGKDDWHIRGTSTLFSVRNGYTITADEIWPDKIPKITLSPTDIMTFNNNDLDLYSMADIKAQIDRGKANQDLPDDRIANLEYGYWSKISVPLAAAVFGTLGAVLGIRNHRTGTAAGFALAVAIIFGYMLLANFMNVWAQAGALPAWIAAFLPLVLGTGAAAYLIWRRNA